MTQTLAPLAIVIALFGTEHEIFHFNRNSKSFIAAAFISILLVQLILFIFDKIVNCLWVKQFSDSIQRLLFKRVKDGKLWCWWRNDYKLTKTRWRPFSPNVAADVSAFEVRSISSDSRWSEHDDSKFPKPSAIRIDYFATGCILVLFWDLDTSIALTRRLDSVHFLGPNRL